MNTIALKKKGNICPSRRTLIVPLMIIEYEEEPVQAKPLANKQVSLPDVFHSRIHCKVDV